MNARDTSILTHGTDIAERRMRAAQRLQAQEVARRTRLVARSIRLIGSRLRDAFGTAAGTSRAAH